MPQENYIGKFFFFRNQYFTKIAFKIKLMIILLLKFKILTKIMQKDVKTSSKRRTKVELQRREGERRRRRRNLSGLPPKASRRCTEIGGSRLCFHFVRALGSLILPK